jgi:hypothetical protein
MPKMVADAYAPYLLVGHESGEYGLDVKHSRRPAQASSGQPSDTSPEASTRTPPHCHTTTPEEPLVVMGGLPARGGRGCLPAMSPVR